ncbi:MAG: hypothetical protein NZ700_15250 [Gemmataceae bacterium]|nr:hypothetical protein [Gemmataceae bacterium]MDW8266180.1 hypothetical protein [Gemmataceae bacterium]
MTTLGKILVFINLAFSVLTGALIIMVYVTRTNWHAGYEKVAAELAASRAESARLTTQLLNLRKERDNELTKMKADLDQLAQELKTTQEARDDFKKKLEEEAERAKRSDANTIVSAAAAAQSQALMKDLQTQVEELKTKLVAANEETKSWREKAIKFEIEFNSASDRAQNALTQLEALTREFEKYRGRGNVTGASASGAVAHNPPPEDVRGRVTQTDPQSGLVTISIGSDSGISPQNTLEVYRLEPKPTYVGRLLIMDVRPHEAVGKLITTQRRGVVQVGDEVASNILGKR